MKSTFAKLLLGAGAALSLAVVAVAGPTSYSKSVVSKKEVPPPPIPPKCFEAGDFSVDAFFAAAIETEDQYGSGIGGGIGFNYFPLEKLGFGGDVFWYSGDEVIHNFTASLILRYPFQELCLAPYVLVGGGYAVDSVNTGGAHLGAGIEYRFGQAGIFSDARYQWYGADAENVIIKAGLRFHF